MKIGNVVRIKLTLETGMIIGFAYHIKENYKARYQVRLPNYQVVEFYEFE